MPDGTDMRGLDALLSLHGEIFHMDNGYWTKFEAWRVEPSPSVPHGIRYSLTLHDRYNERVLGYDNAHAVQGRRRRFQGKRIVRDHRHEGEVVEPYQFKDPARLLEDFWDDAMRIMGQEQ